MNYGHSLIFGSFITAPAENPETAVALAQRSEAVGLDLVTLRDHPEQPDQLDAWTVLTWIAGQTGSVQLAANVLNLPLRDPAVLARAAVSLDLLSGGRLVLGLGAGQAQLWDDWAALGVNKLTPGQSITALSEGIDVIRGMWDTTERQPLRYDGVYYHPSGAQRGPTPVHDIPIWLGASKPRALRLLGTKADGWFSSPQMTGVDAYLASLATIDEAARAAGRDPREIRRLINILGRFSDERDGFLTGSSAQWVEDLLPYVIAHGVSGFILVSSDVDQIARFGEEVAPALREHIQREAPEAIAGDRIRRASVLAKRRDGIAYDDLPGVLAEHAIEPGDTAYANVRSTYMRGGAPGLVLMVRNAQEVSEALSFARRHPHLPFGVRSGGHGLSGRSTNDGGIIINLSQMNGIEVIDKATRRIRVGPGARWMTVAEKLAPYGWALSSGDYGGVGVGGLATAGGVGFLAREQGLTIDHLRAVEMVLADGSIVRASETEHPDLFWAVRGAGANFGIVTSFEFEVGEVGNVGWAQLVLDASDPADVLEQWGRVVESSPRDLTTFIIISPPRRGLPPLAQVYGVVDSDQAETIIARLQPIADIAPMYDQRIVITTYATVMANASEEAVHHTQGEPAARSALVEHITPEFAAEAARLVLNGTSYFFQIRAVGGAVSDVAPDATAYAGRSANFSVVAFGSSRERLFSAWDKMAPHFNGLYLSFDSDTRPERINDAFPPATLSRLRELKARYDPDNVFRDNFNITPLGANEVAAMNGQRAGKGDHE